MNQKLRQRNTYTPRNTSLVPVLCDSTLNNDEGSHSVLNLKTCFNNPEVNLLPGVQGGQDLIVPVVYVLNQRGKPLMPTTPRKARILLKKGEAYVVKRKPFVIQLKNVNGGSFQKTTLGIDPGYKNIGLSVTSEKKELYSSTADLRTDEVKLNSERRSYRRAKRNRLWHRKPRFLNRTSSKKKGWFPPSIRHKLDSHIRIIKKISNILPISQVNIEVNNFDIQKINNPDIQSSQYQEGNQLGFYNTREYILHRDNHQCRNCHKSNTKLRVHHITSRQTGGDRPDNLMTLCVDCHDKYHKGIIKLNIKKTKGFKAATFMSTIRYKLVEEIQNLGFIVNITYGYITKYNREQLGLEKTHINDAFVISGGLNQIRHKSYFIKQRRRNNRCLQINRKGFKPSIRRARYKLQPMSLVRYEQKILRVVGVQNRGTYIGLKDTMKKIVVNIKKVQLVKYNE